MLKPFRENLNFLTTLVCIGYGFGDLHINIIIREWLEFHPERRVEIVSPNARDVPPFLLHLFSQVTITARTATEYLDERAGIVRTPKELLERRVGNILRRLGKERADESLEGFVRANQERTAQGVGRAAQIASRRGRSTGLSRAWRPRVGDQAVGRRIASVAGRSVNAISGVCGRVTNSRAGA